MLRKLLANPVSANLLMLMIFLSGLAGCRLLMVRELVPRFSLDAITVSVAWPGADPDEVEEGICIKLEEALDGVEGVKKVKAEAKEGLGYVYVECDNGVDIFRVKDEVETQVDAITSFPKDAEKPIVTDLKFRSDVCGVVLWGELPERQLKELARQLEREMLTIPGVTQTSISGTRDYEISIDVSEDSLKKYNLSFADVSAAVSKNAFNLSSGSIKTSREEIRIMAQGKRLKAKEFMDIPVLARADGSRVLLSQVAKIRDSFDEDATVTAFFNGKPAVSIDVFKTEDEDAIDISDKLTKFIEAKNAGLPETVHLTKFRDMSKLIRDRLDMLIRNGLQSLALVFLVLWLFLDLRLSFWVAMGIPISLAGGLGIMAASGGSLNMLTLFGLIMTVGLIVDDAIVVGESIYTKRSEGEGALDSAIKGTSAVAMPVIASVTTTVVAFIPLFFVQGMTGKFVKEIPVPVIASLTVSLCEALFILPVHLRHLPDFSKTLPSAFGKIGQRVRKHTVGALDHVISRMYNPAIKWSLVNRYLVLSISVALLLLVGGLVKGGVIKFVFFPEADDDFIRAKIELPAGATPAQVRESSDALVEAWFRAAKKFKVPKGKDLTVAVYSLSSGSIDWRAGSGKANFLEVLVEVLPSEERNIYFLDLVEAWQKETPPIPGALSSTFESMGKGPGGKPIELMLEGDNLDLLADASETLCEKLRSLEGIYDVQNDYRTGKREFVVSMKPGASSLGITLDDISRHLHSGYYGGEAMRIQRDRDDIKVKVRYPEKGDRDSIESFKRAMLKSPSGAMIPLSSVADITLSEGRSSIMRQNKRRIVNVIANVNYKRANASEIIASLRSDFFPKLADKYGVTYNFEGQQKETQDSMKSLLMGFPLALFAIYVIIASLFKSYIQPVVIMVTIPFGIIGSVLGHSLFGMSVTIMSMFGMVALSGIVVNDAIVLIDYVNCRLDEGSPLMKALEEGGMRRFRAILLTSLTTFAGLMPIVLEKSLQAQFLKPMAISIAFGVMFATVLTLFLIPCLIAILNDLRRTVAIPFMGRMPTPEEVEPRYKKPS